MSTRVLLLHKKAVSHVINSHVLTDFPCLNQAGNSRAVGVRFIYFLHYIYAFWAG